MNFIQINHKCRKYAYKNMAAGVKYGVHCSGLHETQELGGVSLYRTVSQSDEKCIT